MFPQKLNFERIYQRWRNIMGGEEWGMGERKVGITPVQWYAVKAI